MALFLKFNFKGTFILYGEYETSTYNQINENKKYQFKLSKVYDYFLNWKSYWLWLIGGTNTKQKQQQIVSNFFSEQINNVIIMTMIINSIYLIIVRSEELIQRSKIIQLSKQIVCHNV